MAQEVQQVLELGQANGEIRTDLSAEAMARALIATNDGLMLECLRNDLAIQIDKLVATLNSIVQVGISHKASSRKTSEINLRNETPVRVIDVLKSRLPKQRKTSATVPLEPLGPANSGNLPSRRKK